MATSDWSIIQHMIEEVVKGEQDFRAIVVAGKSPPAVVASTLPGTLGLALDSLPDEPLRRALSHALKTGEFGNRFTSDPDPASADDPVVIQPLEPAVAHLRNHGGHTMSGLKLPGGHAVAPHMHGHGVGTHGNAAPAAGEPEAGSPARYRGAILMQVNREAITRGSGYVVSSYLFAVLASIAVILLIAYVAMEHQVLRPLRSIYAVIRRRKSGDDAARVSLLRNDEIGAVARALNETLDTEDEHGEQLSQINEQLSQAVVSAETANVAKSVFLANMSHELRTPLNAIIGFSDIIQTEALGPVGSVQYREYSKDINQAGLHLLRLINDILDLSKIEAEKDELCEEEIGVLPVIDSALSLVRQLAENNNIGLENEIEEGMPKLYADERRLTQILTNLLTNAIKFTRPGGSVSVTVRCHRDRGFVFQISDTGIGIAPDDIPKVLTQFGQVDSSLSRKHEGSGLGIPLTKALVELHGGSLDLRSELSVGTVVTVRFPAWRIVYNKVSVA